MADRFNNRKTNRTNRGRTHKDPQFRMGVFSFITAVAGAAIGFAAAFAVAIPMLHSEFANQTRQLSSQLASLAPSTTRMSDFQDACAQTAANPSFDNGQVLGASTVHINQPGMGGGGQLPPTNGGSQSSNTEKEFPTKEIGVQVANNTAAISDTGPYSSNNIDQTNKNTTTVTNTNDIRVTSSSSQSATSGNATVSTNTTGGSATTGDAVNTNSQQMAVKVSN